jgi:tetratricopeptide (TPR) repeat protein
MTYQKASAVNSIKHFITSLKSNRCKEAHKKPGTKVFGPLEKSSLSFEENSEVIDKLSTKTNNAFASNFPISSIEVEGYTVLYNENWEQLQNRLPLHAQKKFQSLLHAAQISPKKIYKEALFLQKEHPDVPELDNLITYLHLQNGQVEQAKKLTAESFRKYPDYFFAKINYANECLLDNKSEEIPHIFPSFELKELFPGKDSFHVSEFRGFMTTISYYYLKIKKKDLAISYYTKAYLADPSHPSLFFLEKKLFGSRITRWIKKKFSRYFLQQKQSVV